MTITDTHHQHLSPTEVTSSTKAQRLTRVYRQAEWLVEGRTVDTAWRAQAACKGVGLTDMFFPDKGGASLADLPVVRAVCDGCPVQLECGTSGLYERYGVWGGLTEKERRQVKALLPTERRQALRAQCQPPPVRNDAPSLRVLLGSVT